MRVAEVRKGRLRDIFQQLDLSATGSVRQSDLQLLCEPR